MKTLQITGFSYFLEHQQSSCIQRPWWQNAPPVQSPCGGPLALQETLGDEAQALALMDNPTKVQVFFCVGPRHEVALFSSKTPTEEIKGKNYY